MEFIKLALCLNYRCIVICRMWMLEFHFSMQNILWTSVYETSTIHKSHKRFKSFAKLLKVLIVTFLEFLVLVNRSIDASIQICTYKHFGNSNTRMFSWCWKLFCNLYEIHGLQLWTNPPPTHTHTHRKKRIWSTMDCPVHRSWIVAHRGMFFKLILLKNYM